MTQWDWGNRPTEHHEAPAFPPSEQDGGVYEEFDDQELFPPITYERDSCAGPDPYAQPYREPYQEPYREPYGEPYGEPYRETEPTQEFRTAFEPAQATEPAQPRPMWPEQPWPDESWPRAARRARRRWLVPGLVATAAAVVAIALFLTSGGGGPASATRTPAPLAPVRPAPSTAAPSPAARGALTMAQAQQVLANYTTRNNQANAQRSDTELATVETGSSYAIDAGLYRAQAAQNAAPYPAFGPQRALYYIPRQTAYPRWFVAQVSNAYLNNPKKVTGTEYVLFTQAAAGAPWKNAVEPYLLPGTSAPQVAVGADGLATPVSAGATSLAVSPGRIGQLTAASLDGTGQVPDPGNLADRLDQGVWRAKAPAATVTDQHTVATAGQVFGLAVAGGGALLFYTDAAELTLTPPQGEVMHLSVPGFYASSQALTGAAGLRYLEQFATYVPPRGGSGLRVVADYSAITAAN
jgi:hypothetical protein